MFVIADSDDPDALRKAGVIVGRLRSLLGAPGPDPALEIDVALRPEGKGGALVRTLSSYRAYYDRWSSTWEAQALIRADFGAGDEHLVGRLLHHIDRLRWPAGGPTRQQVTEIRKLKARMETERMPRGTDPRSATPSWGPGGSPTWNGRFSCCSFGTRTTCPICAPPAPSPHCTRRPGTG